MNKQYAPSFLALFVCFSLFSSRLARGTVLLKTVALFICLFISNSFLGPSNALAGVASLQHAGSTATSYFKPRFANTGSGFICLDDNDGNACGNKQQVPSSNFYGQISFWNAYDGGDGNCGVNNNNTDTNKYVDKGGVSAYYPASPNPSGFLEDIALTDTNGNEAQYSATFCMVRDRANNYFTYPQSLEADSTGYGSLASSCHPKDYFDGTANCQRASQITGVAVNGNAVADGGSHTLAGFFASGQTHTITINIGNLGSGALNFTASPTYASQTRVTSVSDDSTGASFSLAAPAFTATTAANGTFDISVTPNGSQGDTFSFEITIPTNDLRTGADSYSFTVSGTIGEPEISADIDGSALSDNDSAGSATVANNRDFGSLDIAATGITKNRDYL